MVEDKGDEKRKPGEAAVPRVIPIVLSVERDQLMKMQDLRAGDIGEGLHRVAKYLADRLSLTNDVRNVRKLQATLLLFFLKEHPELLSWAQHGVLSWLNIALGHKLHEGTWKTYLLLEFKNEKAAAKATAAAAKSKAAAAVTTTAAESKAAAAVTTTAAAAAKSKEAAAVTAGSGSDDDET